MTSFHSSPLFTYKNYTTQLFLEGRASQSLSAPTTAHIRPHQTTSDHIRPHQTTSNHITPHQTTSNHNRPQQVTSKQQSERAPRARTGDVALGRLVGQITGGVHVGKSAGTTRGIVGNAIHAREVAGGAKHRLVVGRIRRAGAKGSRKERRARKEQRTCGLKKSKSQLTSDVVDLVGS